MFEQISFKSITIGLDICVEIWIEDEKLHYNIFIFPDDITVINKTSSISVEIITKRLDYLVK